jgi:hypothetical protein
MGATYYIQRVQHHHIDFKPQLTCKINQSSARSIYVFLQEFKQRIKRHIVSYCNAKFMNLKNIKKPLSLFVKFPSKIRASQS